jgi:ATP-dependent DNA helicase RecQ
MKDIILRPFQEKALKILENPVHLIGISATGSGKSLIYERYAQTPNTRTILITPLVALARQQAKKLAQLNLKVSLGAGPEAKPPPTLRRGESGVWIISPEKLFSPLKESSHEKLREWRPNYLVVDECHCLWDWGRNFRPAFQSIPGLIKEFSIKRSLWLTATLPPQARAELRENLPQPVSEIGEFDVPGGLELTLCQTAWPKRIFSLSTWIHFQKGAGIIFVPTRKTALRIFRIFDAQGENCAYYHAGMSSEERQNLERLILNEKIRIVVATSAFGMGMDYGHLSWVALLQAPSSLLGFAQAIGRVGRAEKRGKAMVFWDFEDFKLLEWMLQGDQADEKRKELVHVMHYLQEDRCRVVGLKDFFSEKDSKTHLPCKRCDQCARIQAASERGFFEGS